MAVAVVGRQQVEPGGGEVKRRSRPHVALHYAIVAVHIGFSASIFHRPYLPEIVTSYHRFDSVMPWLTWGWVALFVALSMTLSRPGTLWGQAAHFISSVWFFLVAGVFAAGVGTTSAVTTYTVLAGCSLVLFAADFRAWLPRSTHIQRITAQPPRWLTRRRDGP